MPTQQTFLGASIAAFSGSLGWGSEVSTLKVTLVEDAKNLDFFNPPDVGDPVFFNYDGWGFAGILQKWSYKKGASGFLYNVEVNDPRNVLEGYQLILDGYTSPISTPNVANIFGYWENTSFGNSNKNETGLPWQKIRDGVVAICNGSTAYGGPISLRGNTYRIDLSALPILDINYRIGGSNTMSLMDFISEICEAASHDFFVTLQANTIVINTIDRSSAVPPGALTTYINNTTKITASDAGVEQRTEVMGKVLLGGQRIDMFGQTRGGERIWPFWGFDPATYDVLIGTGLDNDHEVELDSTSVQVPGVGATYKTNVAELRAAAEDRGAWEDFLSSKWKKLTPATNIHFSKYEDLGIIGYVDPGFSTKLAPALNMPLSTGQITKASEAHQDDHEENIGRLYDFIFGFASEFYGKQFLVTIPNVDATREPDTDKVRVSLEPVQAGFIEDTAWNLAISNNLIPNNFVQLANEDGRFPPYVRYDNIVDLDFSAIPEQSIVYNDAKTSAFIKCTVKQGVAFEDVSSTSGARAVIVLPGIVRDILIYKAHFNGVTGGRMDEEILAGDATEEEKERLVNAYGVDNLSAAQEGMAVVPNLAAIPLQDNTKVYGPWEKVGANGKMAIEQDETLVPWNYGGFAEMNIVGNAKVANNVSFQQELETGSIEVPGIPTFTMGAQIASAGPYVTDINVSIGENGVTSTYTFSTWTQRFGKILKSNADRFSILAKKNAKTELKLRERKVASEGLNNLEKVIRNLKKPKRKGGGSSHGMIVGEGIPASGGEGFYPNVFIQPHYNFTSQLGGSGLYPKKAGVSMDGLFRPFTTNPSGQDLGIPYFQVPKSGAESPHVEDLNPYGSGHDIAVVVRDSSVPSNLTMNSSPYYGDDYRPMALKGPMVMAGWGYDTEGKPVPNESGKPGETKTDNFESGYMTDQSKWPVGPIYMPWDDDRKCWVGGGGGSAKFVRVTTPSGESFPCGFKKVYYAEVMGHDFQDTVGSNVSISGKEEFIYVGNFRDNIILESSVYLAYKVAGKYYLDNQSTFNELG